MCSIGNATAERAAFDYLASLHFRPCSAATPLSIRPHDQTMAGMAHMRASTRCGVEHVHPARRPWSALMDAIKTRVLPLTTGADNVPTAASEAECRRLFDEALKARMPKIY